MTASAIMLGFVLGVLAAREGAAMLARIEAHEREWLQANWRRRSTSAAARRARGQGPDLAGWSARGGRIGSGDPKGAA
ncbi:MAG TPA: hypothetical protein VH062_01865 [Polyangiaceae bacterium]|jgi:hypothetical protein|nr:hypothetical protein [Polyangiaceae bacterium]